MVTFSYILMTMLMVSGLFLIGLILLQRGRGGGLAGAFGGMGGQSAFGTKAGDVFTRITIGVASAWILLCAGSVVALHQASSGRIDQVLFAKEKEEKEAVDNKAAPKNEEAGEDAEVVKAPEAANNKPAVEEKKDEGEKAKLEEPKPAEDKKPEAAAPEKPADAKPNDAGAADNKPDGAKPEPQAEKKSE